MYSLEQVLLHEMHDNDILKDTVALHDAEGHEVTVFVARQGSSVSGAAFQIQGNGYAGPIRLMMGVATDGSILGVRVLPHKETPRLGDRIEVNEGSWILLAMTTSATNGLGMGLATAVVMAASSLLVALLYSSIVALLTTALAVVLDLVQIALLYLLNVVFLAVWVKRRAAIYGALFGSLFFAHILCLRPILSPSLGRHT